MTLLKPTLALRRLAVYKDARLVFDASFHNGVNIVRGQNSSGKTTILDFIAYTLGGEYLPWKEEAKLCDWSVAEVLLNGKAVTLRRPVNDKPLNPMYIFWGDFDTASQSPDTAWEVYGFRRSSTKLSFTQALLLALDLPEAQGDGASNITMHQLLRVLYADQPSLHSPIFRADAFDSALTRETVGAYLSGVYDDKLYVAQLEKRSLEKEVQQSTADLRSIFSVLARSEQDANFEFIGQQIAHLQRKREELAAELIRLKTERTLQAADETGKSDTNLRLELDQAKLAVSQAESEILRLNLDIADSQSFIDELEARLRTLDESSVTRNYFGKLNFTFCPCCLSVVKDIKEDDHCGLCKEPLSSAAADSQVLRMRNELRIQLEESRSLMPERETSIQSIKNSLPELRRKLYVLEQRYSESSQNWSSPVESALEERAREIGSLDQEIKNLYENQRLAETVRQLQEKKRSFESRISEIDSVIESLIYTQASRKTSVQTEVAVTLAHLLRKDLQRQREFQKAENVQFSFTDNVVSVEGSTQFSESSTVVLRHLFHLALLSASTRLPHMRLPRFLILDGIEDGGMEPERSYRLQQLIVEECEKFDCDYQVIFATSHISPVLEDVNYVVGRQFTKDNRSLQIAAG